MKAATMSNEALEKHSPLGGSGASRWMLCPGTLSQSKGIEDEESEFAIEGSAAHTLGEHCLTNRMEPWQMVGALVWPEGIIEGATSDYKTIVASGVKHTIINKEMADAVQDYLTLLKEWHPERNQGNTWVERRFHCPSIHKYFYGTADFVYYDAATGELHIWDYKHGAGIVVEVMNNPQGMYYAAGTMEDLDLWDDVKKIIIHIVQPRGWHTDGPHRTWEVSPDDIDAWLWDKCVPAMEEALVSRHTVAGSHCRFCPARSHACPALMKKILKLQELFKVAISKEKGADALTPAQVGAIKDLETVSKIMFKAVNTTALGMLSSGIEVPGVKLVNARKNKEFKKGAAEAAKAEFGAKCMTTSVLKSPNQMDSMPGGKDFTARWGFKPQGALTVASEADPRRRVLRSVKSLFTKKVRPDDC